MNAEVFPTTLTSTPAPNGTVTYDISGGLTKREYFASVAMQAMLSAGGGLNPYSEGWKELAGQAISQADMLIAALAKVTYETK